MGFANNNNSVFADGVWASYLEARTQANVPSGSSTIGLEIDTYNAVASFTSSMQPYNMFPAKATMALWLASGAGFSPPSRSHLALGILNNGPTFDKGIVFQSTALERSGGGGAGTTAATAMEMAQGHQIVWKNSDNSVRAKLDADFLAMTSASIGPQTRAAGGANSFTVTQTAS